MDTISRFYDQHEFLSNFHTGHPIEVGGMVYPTVEHAFQAQKFPKPDDRVWFTLDTTPGKAKQAGRQKRMNKPRKEWWDSHGAEEAMYEIITAKFMQHDDLRAKLLATEAITLIEGNRHHDNRWGDCTCGRVACAARPGKNQLGLILMRVRDEIRERDIVAM